MYLETQRGFGTYPIHQVILFIILLLSKGSYEKHECCRKSCKATRKFERVRKRLLYSLWNILVALEYDKVRGARKMKTTELLIRLRDPHHPLAYYE